MALNAMGLVALVIFCGAMRASAHVRLEVSSANAYNIRNAPGPGSNGRFSVNGPCGGVNAFNEAAAAQNQVQVGSEMDLQVNYNGGHASAQNQFVGENGLREANGSCYATY